MRAVVFDFDGVIVDSEPVHEIALRRALEAHGLTLSHEEFLARCVGVGDRNCLAIVARAQGHHLSESQIDALMAVKREAFATLVAAGRVVAYEGTLDLMRAAAESGPIAVCSGSGRHSVEPVLRRLDLLGSLAAIITADDVTRTKPDPAPYLLTAARLGVAPESCVAIEDTPTGIRAARGAGLRVAAVCHTVSAEKLSEAHQVYASTLELTMELLRAL